MTEITFRDAFNIPNDLIHDHGEEAFKKLTDGINRLDLLLNDNHTSCIDHVVKYSELNIKFFFVTNLLPDKTILKDAFDLYMKNMIELFFKENKNEQPLEG